jgi:hypothetical protein
MMSRLEFFDKGYGLIAFRLGAMSYKYLWWYDIYKTYETLIKAGWVPTDARQRTMITKNEEYLNVSRAIYFFERPNWTDKKQLALRNVENQPVKASSK